MRTIEEIFRETIATKEKMFHRPEIFEVARQVADEMVLTYRRGGRVYFCGNGGSAADAQHFAAELTGHFIFDRPPLAAEVLHGNTSHLTAVGNDYDYESVFARALQGSVRAGDILVAISTSGNSPSIIRAAEVAKSSDALVVVLTGETGGNLKHLADLLICVPSTDTGRIQESHIVFIHAISEHVEHVLFAEQFRNS